jgi:hypothetical protein
MIGCATGWIRGAPALCAAAFEQQKLQGQKKNKQRYLHDNRPCMKSAIANQGISANPMSMVPCGLVVPKKSVNTGTGVPALLA